MCGESRTHGSEGGLNLAGRATARYPRLPYTLPSGQSVCNFSVAVSRRWTNQNGQSQEETTWFRVAVWGRQAETANQYLAKGKRVLVEGRVSARAFIGNDGQPRTSLELNARDFRFLSSRQEDAQEGGAASGGYSDQNYSSAGSGSQREAGGPNTSDYGSSGSSAPANNESSQEDEDDMDEIPF